MDDFLDLLERKRPTFIKNKVNESILKNLKDRKVISAFVTDKSNANLFRATGRKRLDILAMI
ncbi:MAG: hypothetical protein L0J63_13585 [Tetragenococcus koreensis]|nr:hypothetical protein [Tetragenococcus koreensis]